MSLDPTLTRAQVPRLWMAAYHGWPEADTLWTTWRDVSISDPDLLQARAMLAAQQGAWAESARDLDAAIHATEAPLPGLRLERAVAARCSERPDLALADARAVLSEFSSHERLRACWLVADLEVAAGRPEAARDVLRQAECRADHHPDDGSLESLRADLDAQLTETYGTRWALRCDASDRKP